MSTLKICRVCLRTEAKGYKFNRYHLKYFYEEVVAQKVTDNDLPQWFCYECAAVLHKFHKFKEKCYMGQKYLKELLWKGPLTYEAVYKIDQKIKKLQSTLQTINVTDKVKTFTIRDCEHNSIVKTEDIIKNNAEYTCGNPKMNNFVKNNINMACSVDTSDNDNQNDYRSYISEDPTSPISLLIQEDKVVNLKSEDIKTTKTNNIEIGVTLKEFGKYLSEENWKKLILTEDEAVKEFRGKAEDPKYLDAAYKCLDCFKGFSKKDMLNRHVQCRHSEDLGNYECRFCRMRFRWQCHLRRHTQQHYIKYECLRCHIVFHLDTSALLHEEYHSGSIKKCAHCGEEFRHITTYYTHMRTHRSAHVCLKCGASFVSKAGLRQHARRKHPEYVIDSPSSDESDTRDSYCARCDLRFDSRRAHTEHLFHSDMHTEEIRSERDEITPAKKILGKRLREKITKELKERKCELDIPPPVKVRRKRIKRKHRKPSTCHQCGQEFSTQAACMKHHVAAHPRTSFHAPYDRHICELCGASLAPGSVAVHQNMHSREKVFSCDTCARQFHSAVGLKRHLVTHTGEKPFACPLCEKRFTQSNSMKLHCRTFHFKQPYPKRVRKKKKEQIQSTEQDDTYEEDSDSVSQPEHNIPEATPLLEEVTGPEVTPLLVKVPAAPEIPANGMRMEDCGLEDENMHYLTLG